jgi:SAM-dependent methyltransferase
MNVAANTAETTTSCLIQVGRWLRSAGYCFVTPTPATHRRIDARTNSPAASLRDAFGWSRAFAPDLLAGDLLRTMDSAGLLDREGGGMVRSLVRYSSLAGDLFAHSAFPTDQPDAIFFGPDTYRFASLIEAEVERRALRQSARILDVGCGAGPGGIVAARRCGHAAPSLVLADINAVALQYAAANAALAGIEASFVLSDLFEHVTGEFDLIVSNPPYLNDPAQRTYRNGGGEWGAALSERVVREGVHRLAPGGRLVLYTGVAIVDGRDPFIESLRAELDESGWSWRYRELDPDVFGEELEQPAYARADRIAAVALTVSRPCS